MERFYFHIRTDGLLVPDEEGMDLPDTLAATEEMRASARDLYATHPTGMVEMTDADGKVLKRISARAVLN